MNEFDSKPSRAERSPRDPEAWRPRSVEKYWRPRIGLEFRPGAAFFAAADPVVHRKKTLLGYDRLYVLWQAVQNVMDVAGAVAEVGSYRGGSASFIANAFVQLTGGEVPMHVFDTFEGHPPAAIGADDPFHTAGQFNATSYEEVCTFLAPFRQLEVHRGDVSLLLPQIPETVYRLVHVDTDLYKPTADCLRYFGQRMSPGGVIVIDDYSAAKCPGVPKAVVEYLEDTPGFSTWDMRTEQLLLVKR